MATDIGSLQEETHLPSTFCTGAMLVGGRVWPQKVNLLVLGIGVLFGCFGRKTDGDSWIKPSGKPIYFL